MRLLVCTIAAMIAAPAAADTLIDNVKGVTLDFEGRVQRFNAILIGDDNVAGGDRHASLSLNAHLT